MRGSKGSKNYKPADAHTGREKGQFKICTGMQEKLYGKSIRPLLNIGDMDSAMP